MQQFEIKTIIGFIDLGADNLNSTERRIRLRAP